MSNEAKKLLLIEEILKIENSDLLYEVETLINKIKVNGSSRRSFTDFAGALSDEEADELERTIQKGCEQIHPDDWK